MFSIAVTVTGIVAIPANYAFSAHVYSGLDNLRIDRIKEMLLIITVTLGILATINTIFITWATVLDARRPSALARAFGATPLQVSAGLSAAHYLFHALTENQLTVPPLWQLLAVLLGTLLVVTGLTAIPARLGARRPSAAILQAE